MRGQCRCYRNLFLSINILIICTLSVLLYISVSVPKFNENSLPRKRLPYETNPQKLPTILLWNDFWGDSRWGFQSKDTLLPELVRMELGCPVYQCQLTNNPEYLPSIEMFDAVVIHTPRPFRKPLPSKRSSRQLYIFAQNETPLNTKHALEYVQNVFNLTMTYRLDSDLLWPYKSIIDIENGAVIAPANNPTWKRPSTSWNESKLWNFWSSKTKDAAWFASHCHTFSEREMLVNALQRHINIDIFGKCGLKSCARASDFCDEMLDTTYKFYLSFENSLCADYVTEKFYRALEHSIIPVVFGGADYQRFAPPYSYINAENFESVEALAKYLKYVASNATEYLRYFWWRPYYRVAKHPSPFCALCEKLNNRNFQDITKVYNNIEHWWTNGSCYLKPKIRF